MGAIINEEGRGRYSHQTLLSNLQTVLYDLEQTATDIPARLDAVVMLLLEATRRHTHY